MTPEIQVTGMIHAAVPGLWWLAGLVPAALVVLAATRLWRSGQPGRMRTLRRRLNGLDLPAAASTVGGRILCANAAMRSACGEGGAELAPILARGFEVDPAAVYRLATAARRLGFGFEETRTRADSASAFLTARLSEPDVIVWSVVPPEGMPRASATAPDPGLAARVSDGEDEAPSARAALESVPVALMQLDHSGRVLWCNAHAREIIGNEPGPGAALSELVEPLGRPLDALLGETAARSSSRREMVRLRDGADDTFLHIALTPVALEGTPCLLAVLSDASELRHLEDKFAQSQKMEAVGKLAGGVAHDFNNVLTAISGYADLLHMGKDALDPDYSDLMQIRQNANRAAALVRQLLAFSRK